MLRSKKQQIRDKQIESAMPVVKQLIKRFGLNTINDCLARLAQYRKNLAELEIVKKKMAELEKKI